MEIEEQIIDEDGSCRDVNFPEVNKNEAVALLKHMAGFCVLYSATDSEGNQLAVEDIARHLSSTATGTIASYWQSQGLISQLQIFLAWKDWSDIFVELTFFPQDVDRQNYSLESFLAWLRPILVALKTDTYYVRYENASWKYGDTSEFSGVIISNARYATNG
jgi:hypothetical protein